MTGGGFIAGSIVGKLLLDKTGWNQSISAVDKDAAKLKDSAKQIGVQFDAVGQKMQAMGIKMAAAGAVITGAMGLIITKTANLGDEFYDLSQRTGIAVEMLSSFKLAADKSGTSIGGFATGMKGLSRVMFEAASGSKEAQGAFKSIGVSATDSSGKLRPLDQVMMDVADRFSAMDDGAVKSALAMKLFGKSGIDLIPMLNLGRAGLEAEADAAQRLGLVMSTETAKACDKFNDSLADLKGGVQGAFQQIAMTLIPSLTRLTEKVVGVIGKVTAWAKEHPGLTRAISGTVLGLGALLTVLGTAIVVVGTVLRQVPLLISGLQALKGLLANPMALIIITSIPILTKATANFVYELKNMNSTMRESGQSGFISFLEGVNSGIRRVALGMKDSNIVLSEANALALLFAREGGRGTRDILLADADAANKFIPALDTVKEKVQSLQEQLGITFRAETEERIKKLNEALLLYRGKLTAEEIARIYGEINTLTESLTRLKGPVFDLDAAIKGMLDGLDDTAEEVASAIATLFDDGFEEIKRAGEQVIENDLPSYLKDLPPVAKTAAKEVESVWVQCSHVIEDSMKEIASAIVGLFNFKGLFGAVAIDVKFDSSAFDAMVAAATSAYDKVKAAIESSVDALKAATAKEIDLIRAKYDAMLDAAKKAYNAQESLIKATYDAMMDAAKKAFDATEELLKRAEDDADRARDRRIAAEDRARERQYDEQDRDRQRHYDSQDKIYQTRYEREKKRIEDSTMTEKEKQKALAALEKKYDAECLAREIARENAKAAREQRREDAKTARDQRWEDAKVRQERRREDMRLRRQQHYDEVKERRERRYEEARLRREEIQERKLEAIRREGARKEQALRDASAKKELALLAELLRLQNVHQADLTAIRVKEDAARQAQADKETARQSSLWFKVKGIFATACENMATIFLTKMLEPVGGMIADLAKKLIGKGKDSVAGALGETGKSVTSLGKTIGEFISGIGAGIGGFISGLATGVTGALVAIGTAIGTVIVTLATAIASAATILAAAAPAFIVVGLIALGIYATIAALKRLFAKAGSGAGDGMGRVVERQDIQISLLTQLRDLSRDTIADLDAIKTTLWSMAAAVGAVLSASIKLAIWKISTATQQSSNYLKTAVGYLKDIAAKIGKLATPTKPVTPTKPFTPTPIFGVPAPSLQAFGAGMVPAATPTSQSGTPVNLTFNVNAIDRAGVETFLRRDARPILQRMLTNLELRPVAAGIGG